MNAAALLADLEVAGVQITREGGTLRVRENPGVSLAPYRDQIVTNKPAILRELLEREIVAAVAVEPEAFDRARYEHLWQQWHALAPYLEAELTTLTDQLDAEWNWLRDHPDHAEHDAVWERWTARLRTYEQVFRDFERSMT